MYRNNDPHKHCFANHLLKLVSDSDGESYITTLHYSLKK